MYIVFVFYVDNIFSISDIWRITARSGLRERLMAIMFSAL
jgi:hypothetical protein